MSLIDEKLSRFEAIIFEEINEKIAEIDKEVDSFKAAELEKAEISARADSEAALLSKKQRIASSRKQEITKASLSVRQSLLKRRSEITDMIFENAEQKLKTFAESHKYKDFFITLLERAIESFPKEGTVILVREQDLPFADDVKNKFGLSLKEDKRVLTGGFILENKAKGLLMDHTLHTRLFEQKTAFIKNSGMFIDYTADSLAK